MMDQQGDAQEDQIAEDSIPELESYSDDSLSASDKDGDEYAAAGEPEDDIVDKTVSPSPKNIRTRSNTRKVIVPDLETWSDPDEKHIS